jgi:hypothetical protein
MNFSELKTIDIVEIDFYVVEDFSLLQNSLSVYQIISSSNKNIKSGKIYASSNAFAR